MGLSEDVRFLKEKFQEIEQQQRPKDKKFKLPFGTKVSPRKAKKGYVTVFKINENGFISAKREPIKEQTIMVDGIPRLAAPEHILHLKKNPVMILPSWSVTPYSPAEQYQKSLKDGSNTAGYKLLMDRMQTESVHPKRKIGWGVGAVIAVIVVIVVAYALLTGGG
jgi:hypothetical protein